MLQWKSIEWLNGYKNKQDLYICCLQETHCKSRDTNRLKVKKWKNVFQGNGNEKTAGVAIIISDKIDLKMETTIKTQRRIFHCWGPLMDRNLVVWSQPIRSKGERKRLIFLGLHRKPIKPLHGACSVHRGLRCPLDGVKVQSTFLRGS